MAYLGRKGASAALTTADIPDNSITSAKIVDGAVAVADLGPNSVDSSELVDGSIDTSHFGDDQVTGAKLANNIAISTTGAITTTGAFTSVGITDGAVGATAITIDSDERVGIGSTSMSSLSASGNQLVVGDGSGSKGITIHTGTGASDYGSLYFTDTTSEDRGQIRYSGDDAMGFYTGGGLVMTATLGKLGIGIASPSVKLTVVETGTSTVMSVQNTAAEGEVCFMVKGTDGVNNCQITGAGAATFTSHSSDERKKLILGDMPNCLAELNKLPLKRFKWRKNFDPNENEAGRDEEHWGVIAQELEKIIPELVYEDAYGSKTIDPLTMTGLCIKAIQELTAKNAALEARVTALESA